MDNKEYKEKRLLATDGYALTQRGYNIVIGLTTLWGVLINIFMNYYFSEDIIRMNYLAIIIVYFIGSFACIYVIHKSVNPMVSFLGFTGLACSMGLLLTYFLTYYNIADIRKAFVLTAAVTCLMTALSAMFPKFFSGLGRVLFISLLAFIIVELVMLLFGIAPAFMDFICAGIFCLYLGYDWAKAQEYPYTLDNAVDSAADIYVDIVNLFVRILSIISRKK